MGLNQEIEQILAGYNTPAAVGEMIASEMARIDQDHIAPGIQEGEKAPDFTLRNSRGETVSLAATLRDGPAVVAFFRGAWCPVCNLQVAALHRALPTIRAAAGRLIAVHPDRETFEGVAEPGFEVCFDPHQAVIRAYRLQFTLPPKIRDYYLGSLHLDISQRNLDGSWNLPAPGVFIIDPDGIVRRRHVTADFTRRMEPEDVVEALNEIQIAR